uniref:Uncharacterized protein n=1 Tax=Glossina palpalis gambiensis TaxID=67801 RepID=A0A1B0ASI9_9MUSC
MYEKIPITQLLFGDEDEDEDENHAELNIILEDYLERIGFLLKFKGDTRLIYSCALHRHQFLCAAGSEDDHIFVCNRNSGLKTYEFLEHKYTFIAVNFNHDGMYLVDLVAEIILHKLQKLPSEGDEDGRDLIIYTFCLILTNTHDTLNKRIFVWEENDDIIEMQGIHKYTLIVATIYYKCVFKSNNVKNMRSKCSPFFIPATTTIHNTQNIAITYKYI